MNTCKTCKYWIKKDKMDFGECTNKESVYVGDLKRPESKCENHKRNDTDIRQKND